MGHTEHRQQLIGLARRRAFESYLRFGRLPANGQRPAERKTINPTAATPPALPTRATSFYVWRSVGDDRVRHSHAARNGQVFAWSEPPPGSHPGTEPNCRCWAEPYYGDPAIPDALQPFSHSHQVNTDAAQLWASIETLTRPDGSLAQSVVVAHDGTQISSQFAATLILRNILLPSGEVVRIDTDAGVQSVYLGNDRWPLFQSAWTATGPKVIRARQRVAFLGDLDTLVEPDFDPLDSIRDPSGGIIDPNPAGQLLGPGDGLGIIGAAMLAIYLMQQAAPASQGLSERDEPVLAIKGWTVRSDRMPSPILVGSLTDEQLRQHCRFLPDVQNWTNDAAALLAGQKPILPARTWGSLVHGAIKRTIEALQASIPTIYDSLRPELSFYPDKVGVAPYGQKGSTRLDVVEDRRKDLGAVCDYDVKTGGEGLTMKRLKEIADRLSNNYPGAIIYIIEVRPRP